MRASRLCGGQHAHVMTGDTTMLRSKVKLSTRAGSKLALATAIAALATAALSVGGASARREAAIPSAGNAPRRFRSAAASWTSGVMHTAAAWPSTVNRNNRQAVSVPARRAVSEGAARLVFGSRLCRSRRAGADRPSMERDGNKCLLSQSRLRRRRTSQRTDEAHTAETYHEDARHCSGFGSPHRPGFEPVRRGCGAQA